MDLFPYDPALLREPCSELDRWRTLLDYRGPLPRTWEGRLRRELEAEAVAASTRMEGVKVTLEEVRGILAGEHPRDVAEEDLEQVLGYRDAMSFVLRRADDPAFGWNREVVIGLQDRVLGGRFSLGAGRLRTQEPVFVVNRRTRERVFTPPPGERAPELADEACVRMEEGHPHPALAAAWIHVAVAAVHPFLDGNGRSARILASLAMYRGSFKRAEFTSLEEWWGRHLDEYYASFACLGRRFDPAADVTPFMTAHVEAQLHQVRALDLRQRTERQVWTALEDVAEDRYLDRRLAHALYDAFFGRAVTAGYYRSLTDVSPATVTKDLGHAAAAGLLLPEGERRSRTYVATETLYTEVAGALMMEVAGPPDVARDLIVGEVGRRLAAAGEGIGPSPELSEPS